MATADGERERRWRDLGAYIREQRRLGSLSLRNVSERAGISNPYLSQIERGLRKPSTDIIQRIARALEISAETLYVRAGMLDERADADVPGGLARDPHLTEEQRDELLGRYWAYRRRNAAVAEPAGPDGPVGPAALEGAAGPEGGTGPHDVESQARRRR